MKLPPRHNRTLVSLAAVVNIETGVHCIAFYSHKQTLRLPLAFYTPRALVFLTTTFNALLSSVNLNPESNPCLDIASKAVC
jgi:hypothetical protein